MGLEFISTRIEDPEGDRIATLAKLLVPLADAGYRHGFGSFFVAAGGALGYALELWSGVENLPGGTSADEFEVEDARTVYGTVSLELGMYF